jgi:hypothetical protein
MNEERVAHGLGWFSIGLGLTEVLAGRELGRALGMEDRTGLLRGFGLREIATGLGILSRARPTAWVWGRVAGDALDLAALASGLTEDNPKRDNVALAIATVAGVTAVDIWCAQRLTSRTYLKTRAHRSAPESRPGRSPEHGYSPSARR